jgi:hypothetical protein
MNEQRPLYCLSTEVPPAVWRAFVDVRNRLFPISLDLWVQSDRSQQHVHRAMCTFDAWCDYAVENGWTEDSRERR